MKAYGCVKCQRHHAERDGAIYRDHLGFQSKHGIYRLSERDWALGKLVLADREEHPDGR
jgi:hypothetical protein